MSQTVTLNLPDSFFQPLRRTAEAKNQSIEDALLLALQASLPSLDGLLAEVAENLMELETLDDDSLWTVMAEAVPVERQREIGALLESNQEGKLTAEETSRLAQLQQQADLVMLRKAHAAALLRFRGKRAPTLAELERLSENS